MRATAVLVTTTLATSSLALASSSRSGSASDSSILTPEPNPACLLTSKKLSRCLQVAQSRTQACKASSTTFSKKKAECLCKAYTAVSDCWAQQDNCLEWNPNVVVADKMCALSRRKTATSKTFRAVIREQVNINAAIMEGGGGGAVVPAIINNIDHKYRPRWTHKLVSSTRQRPLGVDPPLHDHGFERDAGGFLAVQADESIFALDFDDELDADITGAGRL
ncbi:hypothetical protein T439DRAFT_377799 [Meredithblackwellia eburnea MCA 4105]